MMTVERNDHDRWFKELITHFFEEFILAFFPKLYEEIDFNQITFLSEELFTDIIIGEKKRIDILVETKLKDEDVTIIIHTEPQAYYKKDFAERMFIYYSRLYEKHRKPIIPIAVFSYNTIKDEPNTFQVSVSTYNILHFQFLKLELNKMKWRDYLRYDNPVTVALLSKMSYFEEEKSELKKEFMRLLLKLEARYDVARILLVTRFFEAYVPLDYEEEMQFLNNEERVKIMELMSSWERKGYEKGVEEGIEKGIEEGIEQGLEKAKKDIVKRLLKQGLEIKAIAIVTEMTEEQIRKIQSENN